MYVTVYHSEDFLYNGYLQTSHLKHVSSNHVHLHNINVLCDSFVFVVMRRRSTLQQLPWLKRIRQRQNSKENNGSRQWFTQPRETQSSSTRVNAKTQSSNAFATSLRNLETFCLTIKSAERRVSSSSGSSSLLSHK